MKINNMLKYIKMFNRKLLLTFSLMITILSSLSCVDGAGDKQVISRNPENVAIIVFNSIPSQFWGNGTDIDSIKVNTGLIPNGSTITAKITNSSLPDNLSGCVVSGSATVINNMATFNFLAPIFIGNMGETQAVNLAVTIETPDGTKINDFVTLIILAVGITPPPDLTVQSSSMNDLDPGFLNVDFTTFGFAPGTMATCTVSNPALGSLALGMVPVSGTKAQGALLVQYLPAVGTPSGTQEVTCAIIMQNPSSVGASCSNVSVNDRTASATAFIDQGASSDVTNPPAPNSMTCTPNPVTGGNSGTCTCNNNNAAGQTINFTGSADLMFVGGGSATADVNGTAVLAFNTLVVAQTMMEQVSCGPAASMNVAQTTVTINPAGVNSLDCVPNPIASDDMTSQLICTCSTDSPLAQVCLEEFLDPDMVISGLTSCISSDANGDAIFTPTVAANVTSDTSATLQCCVSTNDMDCDEELVAQDTISITKFVPPVTSITCTAENNPIGPGDTTFINISTMGFNPGQQICGQVIVQTVPGSDLNLPTNGIQTPEVGCTITDSNGNGSIPFTGGAVAVEDTATVRCFPDTMDDDVFTPGEISDTVDITVDPNAGPIPAEIACSATPASVAPGGSSLITAQVSNVTPATATVCFNFFANTTPASTLTIGGDSVAPVCSITNLANQAFATFTADPTIAGATQTAFITCCIDDGTVNGDCDPVDTQAPMPLGIDVVPPAASTMTLQADDLTLDDGESSVINASTNPAVANGTMLCIFMPSDDAGDSEISSLNDPDSPVSTTDTLPTIAANTLCEVVTNGLGSVELNFGFTMGTSTLGDMSTVSGCIDLSGNGACIAAEPISNTLTFTDTIP